MANKKEIKEISQKELTNAICKDSSSETRYCFILGAGASIESGVPSGQTLAKKWYKEIRDIDEEKFEE